MECAVGQTGTQPCPMALKNRKDHPAVPNIVNENWRKNKYIWGW